jgi:hypothetical protein
MVFVSSEQCSRDTPSLIAKFKITRINDKSAIVLGPSALNNCGSEVSVLREVFQHVSWMSGGKPGIETDPRRRHEAKSSDPSLSHGSPSHRHRRCTMKCSIYFVSLKCIKCTKTYNIDCNLKDSGKKWHERDLGLCKVSRNPSGSTFVIIRRSSRPSVFLPSQP